MGKFKIKQLYDVAAAQTTDATQATLVSATLAQGKSYQIEVHVIAQQSDESNTNSWVLRATLRRKTAGAAELIDKGPVDEYDGRDQSGWQATVDVSGNTVRVRITGQGGTTINWKSYTRLFRL